MWGNPWGFESPPEHQTSKPRSESDRGFPLPAERAARQALNCSRSDRRNSFQPFTRGRASTLKTFRGTL